MNTVSFLNPRIEVDVRHRHLPHWQQSDVVELVTWRLADSLPERLLASWRSQRKEWLDRHPDPWTMAEEAEYHRRFSVTIEEWLDQGHGSCLLRQPELRLCVEEVLEWGEPSHYRLHAWVIMPNHIHVLFSPRSEQRLERLLKTWKGASARNINLRRGCQNKLWQEEYWDRLIRDENHYLRACNYIAQNPRRASLKNDEYTLWLSPRQHPKGDGHSCPSDDAPRRPTP